MTFPSLAVTSGADDGTRAVNGSAYPPNVDDLMPLARAVVATTGQIPSRNHLMRELRVGDIKANLVLARLRAESPDLPTSAGATNESQEPVVVDPEPSQAPEPAAKRVSAWPVILLSLPAFVAVWSGWVGLGGLSGFGLIHPFPGLPGGLGRVQLNTAITLPIGVETYAAYAIRVWLAPHVGPKARKFAAWSSGAALVLGIAGQVAYHLLASHHVTVAPWQVTVFVSSLPVIVVFAGVALAHMVRAGYEEPRR